jgi:hypothetical protein
MLVDSPHPGADPGFQRFSIDYFSNIPGRLDQLTKFQVNEVREM